MVGICLHRMNAVTSFLDVILQRHETAFSSWRHFNSKGAIVQNNWKYISLHKGMAKRKQYYSPQTDSVHKNSSHQIQFRPDTSEYSDWYLKRYQPSEGAPIFPKMPIFKNTRHQEKVSAGRQEGPPDLSCLLEIGW